MSYLQRTDKSKVPMDEIDQSNLTFNCYVFTFQNLFKAGAGNETSRQYSALHNKTNLRLMQTNLQRNPHLSSKPIVSQNHNTLVDWKLYKLYLHYISIKHCKTKNNYKS